MKAYSNFREEQVPEYLAGFKRMIAEFGEKRTDQGLTLAIDNAPDFPPTPARIRAWIPRDYAPRPACPRCVDTEGWVDAGLDRGGNKSVKLCDHTEAA